MYCKVWGVTNTCKERLLLRPFSDNSRRTWPKIILAISPDASHYFFIQRIKFLAKHAGNYLYNTASEKLITIVKTLPIFKKSFAAPWKFF